MARIIPESTIQEIRNKTDIVELVGRYLSFTKKSGQNYFALCPFHNEKSGSFCVNVNKQIFHCFGCHKGGDVFGFIMEIEHITFPEAIKFLGEQLGIEINLDNQDDEKYQADKEFRDRLLALNTEAARYFYKTLISPAGKTAISYLKKRGISKTTLNRFGLGFASEDWQGLYNHIVKAGYNDKEIAESGLFRKNKHGNWYDLFRNRLMFPIIDAMGNVIAFGGRVLDDTLPKYINSPENKVYVKGRHMYGLNLAKRSKADRLIIVEGYMDCITLHQAGFEQTIASLGTALTTNQASLVRKYSEDIVLAYDMDTAGRNATMKNIEVLEDKGVNPFVLLLPDSKDPDDFMREHSANELSKLLANAPTALDYKFIDAKNTASERGRLDKVIYQDLASNVLLEIRNVVVQELYISRIAKELDVSEESINQVLKIKQENAERSKFSKLRYQSKSSRSSQKTSSDRYNNDQNPSESINTLENSSEAVDMTALEVSIINKLVNAPDVYLEISKDINNKIKSSWFKNKKVRYFVQRILDLLEQKSLNLSTFFNTLNDSDEDLRVYISEAFSASSIDEKTYNVERNGFEFKLEIYALELEYCTRISDYLSRKLDIEGASDRNLREQFIKVRKRKAEIERLIKELQNTFIDI